MSTNIYTGGTAASGAPSSWVAGYPGGVINAVPLNDCWASVTPTSGTVLRAIFRAPETRTVTTFVSRVRGTAAGATPSVCRMALETVAVDAVNATFVKVAQTANDTSLWSTTFTRYDRVMDTAGGFPASYTLQAGVLYSVASVIVSAAVMPVHYGTNAAIPSTGTPLMQLLSVPQAGQTDIPATFVASLGSVITNPAVPWMGVY